MNDPTLTPAQQDEGGAQLPTTDDLLGASREPSQLPTAEAILGTGPAANFSGPMSGVGWDEYAKQAPLGRVLNAFGQGAAQGWGTGNLGFSPESEEALKKYGIFNDVTKGQHSIIRSFNEGVMRPAAALVDGAMRAGGALLSGGQAVVAQVGAEAGAPILGRDIAAMPEAFFGSPGGLGIPHPPSLPEINAFRVGESDSAYFGTTNPAVETPGATADLIKHQQEAAANANEVGAVPSVYEPGALGPTPTEAPIAPRAESLPEPADVDEAARRIAPETFNDYDNLFTQRDTLRANIAEAQSGLRQNAEAQAPGAARIEELQRQLQDTTPRLAKKYEAELADLIPKRDEWLAGDQFAMLTRDTPEISRMRDEMQRADYRMRDLAPQVTAAYREAAQQFPEPEAPPAAAEVPPVAPPVPPQAAETPPVVAAPVAPETPAVPVPPVPPEAVAAGAEPTSAPPVAEAPATPSPPIDIATDVSQKMVAAGRPQEEADAAGQLLAAHYEERAARFNGAKGTAQELYASDAPDIRAGRGVAAEAEPEKELAQPGAKVVRGKISIGDTRSVITLMKNADASTFIHETGHAWLEELLSDAKDSRAPQQLIDDVGTVRDWLGAKDDAPISRGQHEKFARGFERYMMEGVAPSRALDRVFAQFKSWLTKIYQTVNGLRAPITDDIRDVFDRLLSTAPEPATVAREPGFGEETNYGREPEPAPEAAPAAPRSATPPRIRSIDEIMAGEGVSGARAKRIQEDEIAARADWQKGAVSVSSDVASLAEADAEHAAPEAAAAAADQIHDERTHTEARFGNTNGGAGTEAGGGGEGRGAPSGAGPAGEHGPSAGPSVPEPETVSAGGNEAAAEGTPTPGSVTAGPAPAGKQPTFSAEPYSGPDPTYLDKAGNIRLELLTDDVAARQALREIAERNGDFMDARRGVVSDAQVLELADSINATAGDLNIQKLRQMSLEDGVPMAARIKAGRQMLLQTEAAVRAAAAAGDAETFVRAGYQLNMVQETVSGITAEWGRAGRAFHDMRADTEGAKDVDAIVREASGRELFQIQNLMQKVNQLGTPAQVAKFTRDAAKPGLFDWIQSSFINSLLSGPFTHAGYTVAGELYAIFRATAESGAAGVIGGVRRALEIGPADYSHLGEVPHELYGIYRGAVSGAKASWEAFKANEPRLPPEARSGAQPVGSGGIIPNPVVGGVKIPIGTVLEAPSRLVTALHTYNWTTFYSASKSQQAAHIAMEEGLSGQALANRIAQLEMSPTPEMIAQASEDASQGALMQRPKYDSPTGLISRLVNLGVKIPDLPLPGGVSIPMGTLRPAKFIDPFVIISSNIFKAALGRGTPLALFSSEVRDDLMMRNGGASFDRTAGKILAGTGFMVGAGSLAARGLLNSSGPSEPAKAAEWRRINGMPHGLHVGNMTYDMLRLGVLGWQMSVSADMYHAIEAMGTEDTNKVASEVVHAFSQNILDESFMRGPAELMRAVEDSDRYGAQWLRNFASAAVPYSVGMGQIAREIDPYTRQARTTMDAILAKTPIASEKLLPRYDVWGQPIANRGWMGTYSSPVVGDATDAKLYSLGVYPSQAKRTIRGVQLTDEQYGEYARTRGRMAKAQLDQLVGMAGFSMLPTLEQTTAIHNVMEAATRSASQIVIMHSYGTSHDIARQAIDAKRSQLAAPPTP